MLFPQAVQGHRDADVAEKWRKMKPNAVRDFDPIHERLILAHGLPIITGGEHLQHVQRDAFAPESGGTHFSPNPKRATKSQRKNFGPFFRRSRIAEWPVSRVNLGTLPD